MANSIIFNGTDLTAYNLIVTGHNMPAARETAVERVENKGVAGDARLTPREFVLEVIITGTSVSNVMGLVDSIKGVLNTAETVQMTVGLLSDRYWNVKFKSMEGDLLAQKNWRGTISFTAVDPLGYSTTETTSTKRIGVIREGLIFYAPMYHEDLDADPFDTKDDNVFSCDVDGPTWSAGGYVYDGTGKITSEVSDYLYELDTIAILGWIEPDITAAKKLYFEIDNGTALTRAESAAGAIADDEPTWIACIYDGAEIRILINGVESGTPVAVTGKIRGINILVDGDEDYELFDGTQGELEIYSSLTDEEAVSIYTATAWRY
jgi:hypothetical protein